MNLSNELLLMSLTEFYSNKIHINKFLHVVNGKSNVSLRLIDWYITNYCKNNNEFFICAKKKNDDCHSFINVYGSYRSQLKAYKKIKFDPFRRRERILFYYNDTSEFVCTTIGQLNFFRWAIEYSILDHIENNVNRLDKLMLNSQRIHFSTRNVKKKITKNDDDLSKQYEAHKYDCNNNTHTPFIISFN